MYMASSYIYDLPPTYLSSHHELMSVCCDSSVHVLSAVQINRNKNKWKFHLKDGIMNLNGKDLVFQKASGDAEW